MSTTFSLKLRDDSQTLTVSKTIRAVCPHDCPDTCSMVISVKDGVAVDLRGDKDHPFTKGFLCQKVNRYLDRTYHKDRVLYPMRRVGPKGAGQFERITWEAALTEIASRLKGIANSPEGPQSILPFSYAGTMGKLQEASIDRRFFHAIGASLLDRTICATAGTVGCDMTLGGRAVADPFLTEECRHIINWGSNTAVTNSHMWVRMVKAQKQGAKIVTIDPYKTPTA
ncbi:MAG: molybdopterin oxidoreductase family protein, partial [Gemmataceae bacterium]|nr:molybdopterin oxidoreductase family protein [Gemmataceae bacterium]